MDELSALSGQRIFFAHQSVGKNLLQGVAQLSASHPQPPKVVESADPHALDTPAWAHAYVGQNGDPAGKIAHFQQLLESGFGERANVAFLKLCYADIDARTDVEALFSRYQSTLAHLRGRFPRTRFVHFTVPLTTVADGLKASVRRTLGMPVWGEDENVQRARYNQLLHRAYGGSEPVFDLAALESTADDGSRQTFAKGGSRYPSLVPGYTYDGGHLTAPAELKMARQLTRFLATMDS